jgi:hypothetical protein
MKEINNENIRNVLKYLEYFENGDNEFYSIIESDEGVILVDPYDYSLKTDEFVHSLYENNLVQSFEWMEWGDEAKRYFENPVLIEAADLETIHKLFTVIVRSDRFVSGHLAEMIDKGIILKLLKRLKEILDEHNEHK